MRYSYITSLVLLLNTIQGSISAVKHGTSILDSPPTGTKVTGNPIIRNILNYFQDKKKENTKEKKSTQNKAIVLKNEKKNDAGRLMPPLKLTDVTWDEDKAEEDTGTEDRQRDRKREKDDIGRHYFRMDPLFDSLKNRRLWQTKRKKKESSFSSDTEMTFWMDDWHEKRLEQKFEAINSSQPRGDVVYMKRASFLTMFSFTAVSDVQVKLKDQWPWGVPCGDPNQHDLPWGTCMLHPECDGEYRIYRGDSFCGRTEFICCALMNTADDMYQGLDLSFIHENSLSSDSDDEKNSHEEKHKAVLDRKRERRKRRRSKAQLKRRLRRSIKRVITEITKLLQRAYRNQTAQQSQKSKELMKFIKKIKKQYRKDRQSLVEAHDIDMVKYDIKLEESLSKIHDMNYAFMNNDTFRDIIVNGTVNTEKLLRFQKSHPVLSLFFDNRRMGGGDLGPEPERMKAEKEDGGSESDKIKPGKTEEEPESDKENPKLFEYDLEYGMLYY